MFEPQLRVKQKYPAMKRGIEKDGCYTYLVVDLIAGRVLGLVLLWQDGKGTYTTKYRSWTMIYCLLVFTVISYLWYDSLGEIMGFLKGHRVAGAYILFALLFLYPLPVIFLAEAKKMNEFFNEWRQFQIEYVEKTNEAIDFNCGNLVIVFTTIKFFYYIFLLVLLRYQFPGVTITATIVACYYYWVASFLTSFWYMMIYYLYKTADRVHELVKNVVRNRVNVTLSDVESIWLDLYRLSKMTGRNFCFTYCYFILFLFLILIVTTYETLIILSFPITLEEVTFVFLTITAAVHPASIPFWSQMAVRKIGEDFFKLVIDLKFQEVHPPKRAQEIDGLLQVISDNQPLIDLGGFVTLENSLITSLMSTMVTYLIVLVQFKV